MCCGKLLPPPIVKPRSVMTGGRCRSLATGLRAVASPVVAFHLAVGSINQRLPAYPAFSSLSVRVLTTRVSVPWTASAYLLKATAFDGWLTAPPTDACELSFGWKSRHAYPDRLNLVLLDNCESTRAIGLCCRRTDVRSTLKLG